VLANRQLPAIGAEGDGRTTLQLFFLPLPTPSSGRSLGDRHELLAIGDVPEFQGGVFVVDHSQKLPIGTQRQIRTALRFPVDTADQLVVGDLADADDALIVDSS